jgi:hypothetical protein
MMPRHPPASKKARDLFVRRQRGIDRKARTLIAKAFSLDLDVAITVIYEVGDEVSMFRSHPDAGRWWPTLESLVSNSQTCTGGEVIANGIRE